MGKKYSRSFKTLVIIVLFSFLVSCSIGTSFRASDIKSFKGTIIPELSDKPILIEKVSMDLIKNEKNRIPLNLPLNLLNYSPESYKIGLGDVLFIYVYGETERLSAALARATDKGMFFLEMLMEIGFVASPIT